MPYTLLLGGARSGKSALSIRLAASSKRSVEFVATAEPRDEEMAERIRGHRAARPPTWTTHEVPHAVAEAVDGIAPAACVVLDCLSLWVSNRMEAGGTDEVILTEAEAVASALSGREGPAVVISNEVGLGIVPANALARRYRDLLGRVNAEFVEHAARAYFVVAGRALSLEEPRFA